jgi:hypothetical protein
METKKQRILKTANLNLRLSKEHRDAFKKVADKNGEYLSETLRRAIDEFLANRPKK